MTLGVSSEKSDEEEEIVSKFRNDTLIGRNLQESAKRKMRKSRHESERARTKVNGFAARISRVQVHVRRPTPLPMDLQTYFRPFKDGRSCVHHPTRVRNRPSLSRENQHSCFLAMFANPSRMSFIRQRRLVALTNERVGRTDEIFRTTVSCVQGETKRGTLACVFV